MPKWDYAALTSRVVQVDLKTEEIRYSFSTAWTDKNREGKTSWDSVEEFGNEGWELVSCFPVASSTGGTVEIGWVFKRSRAE